MSVETHRVLIGACGWQHPAWSDDFYDEDLPTEWQLGFYSNEFPVVYVPAKDWLNVDALGEWQDEVSEDFRFILEVPGDILNDTERFNHALASAKKLADFCLGLVLHVNQSSLANVDNLEKHVSLARDFTNVCIDTQGLKLPAELGEFLREQKISTVWDGVTTDLQSFLQGSLALTRVNANALDMTQLRQLVEGSLHASTENCTSVLCLDGDPPSLEKIRNADTILNLL